MLITFIEHPAHSDIEKAHESLRLFISKPIFECYIYQNLLLFTKLHRKIYGSELRSYHDLDNHQMPRLKIA